MIVFSIRIVTPDESRSAVLRALGSTLAPTRMMPGCTDARLYADLDERKVLVLAEEWETREQFEEQLDSRKLRALAAAIELSGNAPVVCIDTVVREVGNLSLAPAPDDGQEVSVD